IDQNGLARPGLSGQQIQASRELDCQVIDDRVIFEPQFGKHGVSEVERSIARNASLGLREAGWEKCSTWNTSSWRCWLYNSVMTPKLTKTKGEKTALRMGRIPG